MGRYGSHTCRCGRCGAEGHNARSCSLPPGTPIMPDRRRGGVPGERPHVLCLREVRALVEADRGVYDDLADLYAMRPRLRCDCVDGPRPCPWWTCIHHLGCDVTDVGTLRITWPDREPWEIEETCALDVAGHGPHSLEDVARVVNLTRERTRQIEERAMAAVRAEWRAAERRQAG